MLKLALLSSFIYIHQKNIFKRYATADALHYEYACRTNANHSMTNTGQPGLLSTSL